MPSNSDTGMLSSKAVFQHPLAFDLVISKFKDHGDNDESGLEQLAGGVVFEVVSNTHNRVVGTLTTNVYGFASTKDQPEAWYGAGKRPAGAPVPFPTTARATLVREVAETVLKDLSKQENTAEQTAASKRFQYIVDNHALSTHTFKS